MSRLFLVFLCYQLLLPTLAVICWSGNTTATCDACQLEISKDGKTSKASCLSGKKNLQPDLHCDSQTNKGEVCVCSTDKCNDKKNHPYYNATTDTITGPTQGGIIALPLNQFSKNKSHPSNTSLNVSMPRNSSRGYKGKTASPRYKGNTGKSVNTASKSMSSSTSSNSLAANNGASTGLGIALMIACFVLGMFVGGLLLFVFQRFLIRKKPFSTLFGKTKESDPKTGVPPGHLYTEDEVKEMKKKWAKSFLGREATKENIRALNDDIDNSLPRSKKEGSDDEGITGTNHTNKDVTIAANVQTNYHLNTVSKILEGKTTHSNASTVKPNDEGKSNKQSIKKKKSTTKFGTKSSKSAKKQHHSAGDKTAIPIPNQKKATMQTASAGSHKSARQKTQTAEQLSVPPGGGQEAGEKEPVDPTARETPSPLETPGSKEKAGSAEKHAK